MTSTVTDYILPMWRPGVLRDFQAYSDLEVWSLLGLAFDDLDDDAVDFVVAVTAYAWRQHMNGTIHVTHGDISVHDNIVVFDGDIASRGGVTRTRTQATRDLIAAITTMLVEGSPLRKVGTRLIEAPATAPRLRAVMLG